MTFISFIALITLITLVLNIRILVWCGIANHVWQDQRAAIAKTVNDLGDQFRPAMCAGWLAYI